MGEQNKFIDTPNNQTSKEHRDFVIGKEDSQLGVGIFLYPTDGDETRMGVEVKNERGFAKHIKHDLTYNQTVELGGNSIFKFISYGIDIKIAGKVRFYQDKDSFPNEWFC